MDAANRESHLNQSRAAVDRAEANLSSLLDGGRLELIHRNQRHVVARGRQGGRPVVVKRTADPPAADAIVSLRHEHELLRDCDLPGVVKVLALARTGEGLALVMEDAGRRTLAERIAAAPLRVPDFLEIAVQQHGETHAQRAWLGQGNERT